MAERKIGEGAGMAFLRQGAREAGEATKAFPTSISVEQPGAMFNPLQSEVAEENRNGSIFERLQEGRERAAASKNDPEKDMTRE